MGSSPGSGCSLRPCCAHSLSSLLRCWSALTKTAGSAPVSVPWKSDVAAGILPAAQASQALPGEADPPLIPLAASPSLVLPVPHFIRLPYRWR